jgi:hypothetical protein
MGWMKEIEKIQILVKWKGENNNKTQQTNYQLKQQQ